MGWGLGKGWGLDALPTCTQQYCDPASLVLFWASGTSTTSALTDFESEFFKDSTDKNPFAFPSETPSVLRVVKNCSEIFHPHKSESNYKRVPHWKAYMKSEGIVENVVHFEHTRAGIIFPGATRVLLLRDNIKTFLENETSPKHRSVLFDLNNHLCNNQLISVAVFDVLVVDALWRRFYGEEVDGVYVKKKIHMLDIAEDLNSLRDYLRKMVENSNPMLEAMSPFKDAYLNRERITKVLAKVPDDETARYIMKF